MSKLLFFTAFLISIQFLSASAEAERSSFGTLIDSSEEIRSVPVSDFDFRTHVENWCTEYEDGNSYDGACLKEKTRCYFEAIRNGKAFLGHDETYVIYEASPAFPGLDVFADVDCEKRVKDWAKEHASNVVTYRLHQDLFHRIYVNNTRDKDGFICYDDYIPQGYATFGNYKHSLRTEGERIARPENWGECFELSKRERNLSSTPRK